MYLFHSEANENERPERGQALADSVYQGIRNMMTEVFGGFEIVGGLLSPVAVSMAEEPVQSLVENTTLRMTSYPDLTNDLLLSLTLNAPQIITGISNDERQTTTIKLLRDGQLIILRNGIEYDVMGRSLKR